MVGYVLIFTVPGVMYFLYCYGLYAGLIPGLMNSIAELFVQVEMRLAILGDKFHEYPDKRIVKEFKSIIADHRVAIE